MASLLSASCLLRNRAIGLAQGETEEENTNSKVMAADTHNVRQQQPSSIHRARTDSRESLHAPMLQLSANRVSSNKEDQLSARDSSAQSAAAAYRRITVTGVNQFLQTLVAKRLYEELAASELAWQISGYLGSLDNKLRNQTYWGVALTEEETGGTESLKLAIPKHVADRAGAKGGDYVCATGTLRVSQQFRTSSFEVYLAVSDLQLLDAPGTLGVRRQETSTLQALKSLPLTRNPFPAKLRPSIAVVHSRSQDAQV